MIDRIAQIHHLEGRKVHSVNGEDRAVSVTPALIGAAANGHTHEEADVNGLAGTIATIANAAETVQATAKATVTLQEGVSVIPATTSGISDVEIAGRTLVSLGNSNLEAGKKYVIADPKTKVIVDKNTVAGVGKFVKGQTTFTVADFSKKTEGSTVSNPHISRWDVNPSLNQPTSYAELSAYNYGKLELKDDSTNSTSSSVSGDMAQHKFSFNVVEQIERELGLIPGDTFAEKVEWVRENVYSSRINWYGYGSGPVGNKAELAVLDNTSNDWFRNDFSTSNSSVTRIWVTLLPSYSIASPTNMISDDGYLHFTAYAEPSDGVTASVINTDYVSLEITLEPTAQLNTRPGIIRAENFEGKVSGSTAENPHYYNRFVDMDLVNPHLESLTGSVTQTRLDWLNKLDGSSERVTITENGRYAQQLFSFNLIEAVERHVGKIPANAVAGKVGWLKENIRALKGRWNGYGSGPSGNKATVARWVDSGWATTQSNAASAPAELYVINHALLYAQSVVQSDGFVHFIAYAEPSDGVTASTINTDYIELEIELKPDADFHAPRVPLYEVDDASYNNILAAWPADEVIKRYPAVEGMQHLTNPYVIAEGDNLLPPFTEWDLHPNVDIISPYEVVLNGTSAILTTDYVLRVNPGEVYTFSFENSGTGGGILVRDSDENTLISNKYNSGSYSFTTPPTAKEIYIRFFNPGREGIFEFKNFILTLGSEPKPFIPMNPSRLAIEVKLGELGGERDFVFKEDGKWKVQRNTRELTLDGSLPWSTFGSLSVVGVNEQMLISPPFVPKDTEYITIKNTGEIVPRASRLDGDPGISYTFDGSSNIVFITPSKDSGIPESINPSGENIKRYFNGWKYTDGTTWTSVTGNGQTATAQEALDTKPTDYTPYKLSYVLAEPVIEEISVEGELKVDGLTQVEVGSGVVVRETVTPAVIGSMAFLGSLSPSSSKLLNDPMRYIEIYKGGVPDIANWTKKTNTNVQGLERYETSNFDPVAEYTVTYLALDKHKLTTNISDTKFRYPQDFTTSFRGLVTQAEDVATRASVNKNAMLEAYIELQALKGGE